MDERERRWCVAESGFCRMLVIFADGGDGEKTLVSCSHGNA